MTICELGKEWDDPTQIPVEEIVEEWRSQSTRGRYESAMWRAAGLEEPNGKWKSGVHGAAATWEGGEQVDNMTAGGFFGWYGRERNGPQRARPTVMPAPVPAAAAAPSDSGEDSDGDSDDSV